MSDSAFAPCPWCGADGQLPATTEYMYSSHERCQICGAQFSGNVLELGNGEIAWYLVIDGDPDMHSS